MATAEDILSVVDQQVSADRFREQHWEGSFEDYLKLVTENPRIARNAFQRIFDMILYFGFERYTWMREELTRHGVRELRAAADVDEVLTKTPGTVMVVVNSVCGCAAGKARPGVVLALQHDVTPEMITTVFAGADADATERARSYFTGYPPSSPSIALLRGTRREDWR